MCCLETAHPMQKAQSSWSCIRQEVLKENPAMSQGLHNWLKWRVIGSITVQTRPSRIQEPLGLSMPCSCSAWVLLKKPEAKQSRLLDLVSIAMRQATLTNEECTMLTKTRDIQLVLVVLGLGCSCSNGCLSGLSEPHIRPKEAAASVTTS